MKRTQKGITLVALVITIIILLMLAGISIASLTGSGLFAKAQEAKQRTENAQAEENAILAEYEQWLANYEREKQTLASKVQPGEYVTYTPDPVATTDTAYINLNSDLTTYSGSTANTLTQETGLKWRVLDVVDGKVRLISEEPTTSTVTLEVYNGYNNAVYLLDKTCKTLYSKAGYSENVQNLKIEDIVKYMVTKPTTGSITFSPQNKYYPSILMQEKDQTITASDGTTQPETRLDVSEQTTPINQTDVNTATSWSLKRTFWYKSTEESDFTDSIYYNLFINNGSNYSDYWMSSRCVIDVSGNAFFQVRLVSSGNVDAEDLYNSSGNTKSRGYALRPVITLTSNVLVTSGEGTSDSPYGIGL